MAESLTSRRKLLISGFIAWTSACVPAMGFSAARNPAGLVPLFRNLEGLSTWMRTEYQRNGDVVIHCGTRDFPALAAHAGSLAGRGQKVQAKGNTLTFLLSDTRVRVVIYPDIA